MLIAPVWQVSVAMKSAECDLLIANSLPSGLFLILCLQMSIKLSCCIFLRLSLQNVVGDINLYQYSRLEKKKKKKKKRKMISKILFHIDRGYKNELSF